MVLSAISISPVGTYHSGTFCRRLVTIVAVFALVAAVAIIIVIITICEIHISLP